MAKFTEGVHMRTEFLELWILSSVEFDVLSCPSNSVSSWSQKWYFQNTYKRYFLYHQNPIRKKLCKVLLCMLEKALFTVCSKDSHVRETNFFFPEKKCSGQQIPFLSGQF